MTVFIIAAFAVGTVFGITLHNILSCRKKLENTATKNDITPDFIKMIRF